MRIENRACYICGRENTGRWDAKFGPSQRVRDLVDVCS